MAYQRTSSGPPKMVKPFALFGLLVAGVAAVTALFTLASSLRRPDVLTDVLYGRYRAWDVSMPFSALAFLVFIGGVWLLTSQSSETLAEFSETFRDNQWLVQFIGIALFLVFFVTEGRSVQRAGGAWEFAGKAGHTPISDGQARDQMWTNIRRDTLGVLLGSVLMAYVSACLLSAVRTLRERDAPSEPI